MFSKEISKWAVHTKQAINKESNKYSNGVSNGREDV